MNWDITEGIHLKGLYNGIVNHNRVGCFGFVAAGGRNGGGFYRPPA